MRMLEGDTADADTPVTLDDQTNINAFSRLNSRSDDLTDRLESVSKQIEDIEEVETEMELMDEDELVMYKLDSSFLHLPAGEILTILQGTLETLRTQNDTLKKDRADCEEQMTKLKAVLYAKFGSSINLEKGD